MKVRFRGDAVRVRLTQSEVAALGRGEDVVAATRFGDGEGLRFRVRPAADGDATATFAGHTVTIRLPAAETRQWADTDRVTLAASQPLPGGGALAIVVEKDFACLAPRAGDDDRDTFPHPESGRRRC